MYESHVHSYETYIPYSIVICPPSKNTFVKKFSIDETQSTFGFAFCNGVAESGDDGSEGKSFSVGI